MTYLMTLLTLFGEYFCTGLFAVGGGLATLPFLTQMSLRHPDWFTQHELTSMVAVAESTPGPLGVNMATFIGYRVAGIPGTLVATFALVLPSVVIVLIVARFLARYIKSQNVQNVFSALRPAVTGLIAAACWSILKISLFKFFPESFAQLPASIDLVAVALFVVIVAANQIKPLKKLHPVLYIAAAAVVGVVLKM